MSITSKSYLVLCLALVGAVFLTISKEATAGKYKLKCEGPYQIVQGNKIHTPPCENSYIASVARSYGVKVSDYEVRNNVHKKMEICQFIGHDTRISDYCDIYNGGRDHGFR